jgi:hypothetical protein
MLAWDTERAAAALGPAFAEVVKSAGSKVLKEGLVAIPSITVTGERRAMHQPQAAAAKKAQS